MHARILFFGDCFGRPGRHAISRVFADIKEKYNPDIVGMNVENLAHGKGVTHKTMHEMTMLGVDVFTSGNHVFDKDGVASIFASFPTMIRPLNYVGVAGNGYVRVEKNNKKFLFINLGGQTFFENQYKGTIANPFFEVDKVLKDKKSDEIAIIDFHAEATSEKYALGFYLDGRIDALFGTHTHVPTADERILPKGTAYITDIGMCGPRDAVIGADIDTTLEMFLGKREKFRMKVAETPSLVVNAVIIDIKDGQREIRRLQIVI